MTDRIINDCQEPKPDPELRLVTLEEWNQLTPRSQGYVHYWQAARPGSPLPKESPYVEGTKEAEAFNAGSFAAMLNAQDSDD